MQRLLLSESDAKDARCKCKYTFDVRYSVNKSLQYIDVKTNNRNMQRLLLDEHRTNKQTDRIRVLIYKTSCLSRGARRKREVYYNHI